MLGGVLTEYLSWRWCLYVNLFFAAIAAIGGLVLLRRQPRSRQRPRLDMPGVVLVSASMFCLVYGFSNAATARLAHAVHLRLPGRRRRCCWPRSRWWQGPRPTRCCRRGSSWTATAAASYLAVLIAGAGMFGIFLFLTYYLQQTLHYSPVITGLAFLPMVAMIVIVANLSNIVLLPRLGPKPLVTLGMLLAAVGMVWLTRIGLHSSYAAAVLGPLLVAGVGFGFTIAPSINTGTFGVAPTGCGRGLGHAQHRAADRRLDRHLAAEHDGRQRDRQLPDRAHHAGAAGARPRGPAAGRPGPGARLQHRVLVVSGDLRRRRHDLRRAAAARAARPTGHPRCPWRPARLATST